MSVNFKLTRTPILDNNGQIQRPWLDHFQEIARNSSTPRDNITPTGLVNGTNNDFTLPDAPNPSASLMLVLKPSAGNGVVLIQGVDYTLTRNAIHITTAPASGGILRAWYRT